MTIFGVSNSAKDLGIPRFCKIQGVHEILIGPIGRFQSVTKVVQTVQRARRRPRMRPLITILIVNLHV